MNQAYADWIAANVTETYGKCHEVSQAMAAAFPELRLVRGHYYCIAWGERGHWWLATPDGSIVDPTAAQFPSKGTGEYVEWDDSQPEPTGRCPQCGELCYDGDYLCSDACHVAYVAYCSNPH